MKLSAKLLVAAILLVCVSVSMQRPRGRQVGGGRRDENRRQGVRGASGQNGPKEAAGKRAGGAEGNGGPGDLGEHNRPAEKEGAEKHKGGHRRGHPLVCLVEFTNGTVRNMWACPPRTTCNKGPRQVHNNRTDIDMKLYICSRINGSKPGREDKGETPEERPEGKSGARPAGENGQELERLPEEDFEEDEDSEDEDVFDGKGHKGKGRDGRRGPGGRGKPDSLSENSNKEDNEDNEEGNDRREGMGKRHGKGQGRKGGRGGHGKGQGRKGGRGGHGKGRKHHGPMGCRLVKADGDMKFERDCPKQLICNTNRSQTWNISGEEMEAFFCVPPHHGKPKRGGRRHHNGTAPGKGPQGEKPEGEKPESSNDQKPESGPIRLQEQKVNGEATSTDNRKPQNNGESGARQSENTERSLGARGGQRKRSGPGGGRGESQGGRGESQGRRGSRNGGSRG